MDFIFGFIQKKQNDVNNTTNICNIQKKTMELAHAPDMEIKL